MKRIAAARSRKAQRGPALGAFKFGAALLAGAGVWSEAAAQTSPSQTPPGATAVEASPDSRFSFPPAQGLVAPVGAEEIGFALTDIVVEGEYPALESASAALEARRAGREVSVAEIYAFAAELQQAYFAAGYPLARIVVPPQELGGDGRVRVSVIDGFVEAIDTSQVPAAARARVERVLAPLVGAERPTRELIERRVLLAGDTAGLALSSTLTPGGRTGATVLVLSGAHDAISGIIVADNRVSDQLGGSQATVSVAFNSPFGGGERFYATYAGHPEHQMFNEDARRRYLALGASIPIGDNGLTIGVSGDYSSNRPGGDVLAQQLRSEYSRVGVSMSYPLVRSRATTLEARADLDIASDIQRTDLGGPPATALSADRLRVIRFGLQGDSAVFDGARLGYRVGVSRGLDILDARTASDATPLKPLSRAGADAEFTALDVSLAFAAPAELGVNFAVNVRGRYSFQEPLLRSEQFSPAGADGLSGPPPGLMTGDSGVVARATLERPFGDAKAMAAPYIFGASAAVALERPSALERGHTGAESFGVGVRFGLGARAQGGHLVTGLIEWSTVSSRDPELDREWTRAAIAVRF